MKIKPLDEFKTELQERLKISHFGNLQINIGDKLLLHYAQEGETGYDEDDNEIMTVMSMSMDYYGEHHDVYVVKEGDEINVSYTEGELCENIWEFIEDNVLDHILAVWDALENSFNP